MLKLIPAVVEDTAFILKLHNNPDIKNNFISRDTKITRGQHLLFLKNLKKKGEFYFIIYEDDTRIGTISLYDIDRKNNCAEWGRFIIDKKYPGRGAEALNLLIDKAFRELCLRKLYCTVISHNTKVIELYKNCGFGIEGTLLDRVFQNGTYYDLIIMGMTNNVF